MCNNGISNSFHLNLLKSLEDSIDHRIVVEQPLTAAAMFEDQQKQRERERSANNATTNTNAKNEEQKPMVMMMNHHHGKGNNNNGGGGGGTVPMPLSSSSCSGGFAGSPLLDTGQALSDDPTICPHCNKKFRKPRVLDCLHSMCEDCVIAQLGADIENANKHQRHHPHFGCASTDFELEQHINNLRPTPPGVVRCPMCSQLLDFLHTAQKQIDDRISQPQTDQQSTELCVKISELETNTNLLFGKILDEFSEFGNFVGILKDKFGRETEFLFRSESINLRNCAKIGFSTKAMAFCEKAEGLVQLGYLYRNEGEFWTHSTSKKGKPKYSRDDVIGCGVNWPRG
ncbi:hypothetical protein niasHS_008812 [Heterodera schachtii]|uniref:RING-type domain-containing protein n=1 Tax=Heterodera schachtii TaxID=97005 RepID=A0ABD2J7I6_HETSC